MSDPTWRGVPYALPGAPESVQAVSSSSSPAPVSLPREEVLASIPEDPDARLSLGQLKALAWTRLRPMIKCEVGTCYSIDPREVDVERCPAQLATDELFEKHLLIHHMAKLRDMQSHNAPLPSIFWARQQLHFEELSDLEPLMRQIAQRVADSNCILKDCTNPKIFKPSHYNNVYIHPPAPWTRSHLREPFKRRIPVRTPPPIPAGLSLPPYLVSCPAILPARKGEEGLPGPKLKDIKFPLVDYRPARAPFLRAAEPGNDSSDFFPPAGHDWAEIQEDLEDAAQEREELELGDPFDLRPIVPVPRRRERTRTLEGTPAPTPSPMPSTPGRRSALPPTPSRRRRMTTQIPQSRGLTPMPTIVPRVEARERTADGLELIRLSEPLVPRQGDEPNGLSDVPPYEMRVVPKTMFLREIQHPLTYTAKKRVEAEERRRKAETMKREARDKLRVDQERRIECFTTQQGEGSQQTLSTGGMLAASREGSEPGASRKRSPSKPARGSQSGAPVAVDLRQSAIGTEAIQVPDDSMKRSGTPLEDRGGIPYQTTWKRRKPTPAELAHTADAWGFKMSGSTFGYEYWLHRDSFEQASDVYVDDIAAEGGWVEPEAVKQETKQG